MKGISSRIIFFLLITVFLLGNAPLNCGAVIVDQTNYDQFSFDITEPLVFSTLSGNRTQDLVHCVDFDEAGDLYLTGVTQDTGDDDDGCDTFLMKINGTDFTPIYYTTIKGSEFDYVNDMVVDSGKVYLVGDTGSPDFPVVNAYCDTYQNSSDCFVMCMDATSLEIIFSTYLGGRYQDNGDSIFVDDEGSVYVTGETNSDNFPIVNTYGNYTGSSIFSTPDIYVSKFNSSGNGLIYSSIIGGDSGDVPFALTVDSQHNAYIAGITTSEDFPTINAYNATPNRLGYSVSNEGVVFCVNSTGNGLVFSTFMGGEDSEVFYDIALDSDNDVWVCGYTESDDFPTINNFQDNDGDIDGVLFELSSNGSSLLFSSYIGGSGHDVCYSIGIDERDNIFVTGSASNNFPLVRPHSSLYEIQYGHVHHGFLMKISHEKSILYSTLIGGYGSDSCRSLAVGSNGTVLVGGIAGSDNFPLRREVSGPSYDIQSRGDAFAMLLLDISDEDGDAFPNWWELVNGYDPLNANAPMIEILVWYAPVILTFGVSVTLLVVILILGRHRIKTWIGRGKSDIDLPPTMEKKK